MIPRSTYRVQFHKDFGFDQATKLIPYLARLGISHLYASPYLKARPDSTHGYDIVDHNALNPELGDQAAFDRMNAALAENGLRQILDFVPNHMGVGGSDNPLWLECWNGGRLPIMPAGSISTGIPTSAICMANYWCPRLATNMAPCSNPGSSC